jgi:hypothetical protein
MSSTEAMSDLRVGTNALRTESGALLAEANAFRIEAEASKKFKGDVRNMESIFRSEMEAQRIQFAAHLHRVEMEAQSRCQHVEREVRELKEAKEVEAELSRAEPREFGVPWVAPLGSGERLER